MRILIITQYFWPENFRINELTPYLCNKGYEITVLTGKPNYPEGKVFDAFKKNHSEFDSFKGANIVRIPMIPRGSSKMGLILNYLSFVLSGSIFGLIKLRKKDFDLIFVYEPSPITVGIPAIVISKFRKVPIIFWALDLWPETLQALGVIRSIIIIKLFKKLAKFIYTNCELVLCQSRSFVKNISQYLEDTDKVRFFPSWSEDILINSSVTLSSKLKNSRKDFNIMFAGNIAEAQDMPSVLKAIEISKTEQNLKWIFIGDGRKLSWTKDKVHQYGLRDKVIFIDRCPPEEMPSLYMHADALLVSLKKSEAFSNVIPAKIQTYLKTGKPILGMLDGDGKEVIDESKSGLSCSAEDYRGLAENAIALSKLSQSERQRMGRDGQTYADLNFNKLRLFDKLDHYFKEIIA